RALPQRRLVEREAAHGRGVRVVLGASGARGGQHRGLRLRLVLRTLLQRRGGRRARQGRHVVHAARNTLGRTTLAGIDVDDVLLGRIEPCDPVVEDAARDRRGGLGTEARVLHHQRHGDGGVLGRRECDEERVVAQVLGNLGGVVLLVLLDLHHLRRAGLRGGGVGRIEERGGRGAF